MHAFCEEKGYVCGFIPLVGSTQRDGRDRDRVWWVMGQSLSEEEKRPIELGASPSDANYVLIFMHGLGDTGSRFTQPRRSSWLVLSCAVWRCVLRCVVLCCLLLCCAVLCCVVLCCVVLCVCGGVYK